MIVKWKTQGLAWGKHSINVNRHCELLLLSYQEFLESLCAYQGGTEAGSHPQAGLDQQRHYKTAVEFNSLFGGKKETRF